jgi:hypothetical protein
MGDSFAWPRRPISRSWCRRLRRRQQLVEQVGEQRDKEAGQIVCFSSKAKLKLVRPLRQPILFLILMCLWPLKGKGQESPPQTVAQLAAEIDAELPELVKNATTKSADKAITALSKDLSQLEEQSIMIFGPRKQQLDERMGRLQQIIAEWKTGADLDRSGSGRTFDQMRKLWAEIKVLYPREALAILLPLWSCPMHQELIEKQAGKCPLCGMPLEPIYVTQPQLTQTPIIRAQLLTKAPLEVGKRADLRIRLSFVENGEPVQLSDLEETHTRKVHLLITDISESDYHHEHPEPVGDGEYAFSFTPNRPDTYRVWADLMPVRSRVQQYSVCDIPSATPRQGKLAGEEPENRHAEADGYKFDLSFEKEVIHEKETVSGKLRVTQPDGQPCKNLQVVMGAFGHLVGFCDDFATVLHLHPVGALIENEQALGGPELLFYFRSNKTGIVRLFAQIKIDGKDLFPRFIIRVQPLQHLPSP